MKFYQIGDLAMKLGVTQVWLTDEIVAGRLVARRVGRAEAVVLEQDLLQWLVDRPLVKPNKE